MDASDGNDISQPLDNGQDETQARENNSVVLSLEVDDGNIAQLREATHGDIFLLGLANGSIGLLAGAGANSLGLLARQGMATVLHDHPTAGKAVAGVVMPLAIAQAGYRTFRTAQGLVADWKASRKTSVLVGGAASLALGAWNTCMLVSALIHSHEARVVMTAYLIGRELFRDHSIEGISRSVGEAGRIADYHGNEMKPDKTAVGLHLLPYAFAVGWAIVFSGGSNYASMREARGETVPHWGPIPISPHGKIDPIAQNQLLVPGWPTRAAWAVELGAALCRGFEKFSMEHIQHWVLRGKEIEHGVKWERLGRNVFNREEGAAIAAGASQRSTMWALSTGLPAVWAQALLKISPEEAILMAGIENWTGRLRKPFAASAEAGHKKLERRPRISDPELLDGNAPDQNSRSLPAPLAPTHQQSANSEAERNDGTAAVEEAPAPSSQNVSNAPAAESGKKAEAVSPESISVSHNGCLDGCAQLRAELVDTESSASVAVFNLYYHKIAEVDTALMAQIGKVSQEDHEQIQNLIGTDKKYILRPISDTEEGNFQRRNTVLFRNGTESGDLVFIQQGSFTVGEHKDVCCIGIPSNEQLERGNKSLLTSIANKEKELSKGENPPPRTAVSLSIPTAFHIPKAPANKVKRPGSSQNNKSGRSSL